MRQYKTILTSNDLDTLVDEIDNTSIVAIDTETTGLDIYKPGFELVGISLATSEVSGYYIPLAHKNFANLEYQPTMLPTNVIADVLKHIFRYKATVMHNRAFDRNVLAVTLGITHDITQHTEDTKLAAHLQDENFAKGLKELAKRWLGVKESVKKFDDVSAEIHDKWIANLLSISKVDSVNKLGRKYKKTTYSLNQDWLEHTINIYLEYAGESASINFLFDYMSNLWNMFKYRRIIEFQGPVPKDFKYLPAQLATYYAADDAMNTYGLWSVLSNGLEIDGLYSLYATIEKPVDDVMTRAEHKGILMDDKVLTDAKQILSERMKQAEQEALTAAFAVIEPDDVVRGVINPDTLLNSPKQLSTLLYDKWGYPIIERTDSGSPSTARTVIRDLQKYRAKVHQDKGLAFLQAKERYDALKKLLSTYTDSLVEKADKNNRIHPSFNITGTVSGRMSSNNPNFQNMPRLLEEEIANSPWLQGIDIRKAFIADPGYVFVDADYVSMEMVVCAALSGDENMIRLLNEGRDLHCHTARYAFKVGFDLSDDEFKKKYKDLRQKAKIVNFAMIYGGTEYTLQRNFGFTEEEAYNAVKGYFEGFPAVKVWMENVYKQLDEYGYVVYPDYGYIKRMDAKKPKDKYDREGMRQYKAALRTCQNALIQGYSAFIVKEAIVKLDNAFRLNGMKSRIAFQVHDEIGVLAPFNEAEQVASMMKQTMTRVLNNGVRLDSDVEFKLSMSKNSLSLTLEEVYELANKQ